MRFLRRSAEGDDTGDDRAAPTSGPVEVTPGRTAGKGRPTPKRRDAEGRRRGPAPPPPRTQRESAKLAKANRAGREERRKARAESRGRMAAGDDRALPTREKGPVKAYMRDLIDSRRHLMGLFMPMAILILGSLLLRNPYIQNLFSLLSMSIILAMALEAVLLGRQIAKKVRERFPKETVKTGGTIFYTFTRASQLRRLRVPKPRVKYGDKIA